MHDIEPFYGWLHLYNHEQDECSPFHNVEHNQFFYDRKVYTYPAHPLWDTIRSESLLVKILYANYDGGWAIIELFGEWNDLFENDFKLLAENCLTYLLDQGINKFILVCENVFNIYLNEDDYYEAMSDELEDGWMCLLRARENVLEEMREYNIAQYFYWSPALDDLNWRKYKPGKLFEVIRSAQERLLLP